MILESAVGANAQRDAFVDFLLTHSAEIDEKDRLQLTERVGAVRATNATVNDVCEALEKAGVGLLTPLEASLFLATFGFTPAAYAAGLAFASRRGLQVGGASAAVEALLSGSADDQRSITWKQISDAAAAVASLAQVAADALVPVPSASSSTSAASAVAASKTVSTTSSSSSSDWTSKVPSAALGAALLDLFCRSCSRASHYLALFKDKGASLAAQDFKEWTPTLVESGTLACMQCNACTHVRD